MHDALNKTIEANRLEEDYLERLRRALQALPETESRQILEDVQEHIRATLTERHGGSEIRLSHMAQVLEELGPPEEMVRDSGVEVVQPAPSSPSPQPPPPQAPTGDPGLAADRLDKWFIAFAVVILGLYVPFIDLYICSIIGYAMLVFFLGGPAGEPAFASMGTARRLVIGALVCTVLLFPLGTLGLAGDGVKIIADLMAFPVTIALLICDVCAYWIIMGMLIKLAEARHAGERADRVRRRRIGYLMYYLALMVVGVIAGVVMVFNNMKADLAADLLGYALLPIGWIVGWICVLSPIRSVRRLVSEKG